MAYDRNNPFALILRGELPAHKVWEDDQTLAFMDLMPQTRGHTLVIPKAEAEDLFSLQPDLLAATVIVARNVALAVRAAFKPEGVMLGQLNGASAGQTVFHLHFHVIPRYQAGGFRFHGGKAADPELLAEHAAAIRAHMPA
ncbi:MAG: HIT family protein [Gammaproteobacteria bacterium]